MAKSRLKPVQSNSWIHALIMTEYAGVDVRLQDFMASSGRVIVRWMDLLLIW